MKDSQKNIKTKDSHGQYIRKGSESTDIIPPNLKRKGSEHEVHNKHSWIENELSKINSEFPLSGGETNTDLEQSIRSLEEDNEEI